MNLISQVIKSNKLKQKFLEINQKGMNLSSIQTKYRLNDDRVVLNDVGKPYQKTNCYTNCMYCKSSSDCEVLCTLDILRPICFSEFPS